VIERREGGIVVANTEIRGLGQVSDQDEPVQQSGREGGEVEEVLVLGIWRADCEIPASWTGDVSEARDS
jgi:hypothetical protein